MKKDGRTQVPPSTATSVSTLKATTTRKAAEDGALDEKFDAFLADESPGAAEERFGAIRARIARMTDKQVLGVAGVAFPDDFPKPLVQSVRHRLALAIEQFGEPTATREQAAAQAVGQAVMLYFVGAREVVAEVVTFPIGNRFGWAGAARTASREPRLVGQPDCRPSLNVVAVGLCIQVAAIRAAERLGVLHPTGFAGCAVIGRFACADLGRRLDREDDEMWVRAVEYVDWVLDESRGLLLHMYMGLRTIDMITPVTISHLAAATSAGRLDPRDAVADWFKQRAA
jgi:hypothetical protein